MGFYVFLCNTCRLIMLSLLCFVFTLGWSMQHAGLESARMPWLEFQLSHQFQRPANVHPVTYWVVMSPEAGPSHTNHPDRVPASHFSLAQSRALRASGQWTCQWVLALFYPLSFACCLSASQLNVLKCKTNKKPVFKDHFNTCNSTYFRGSTGFNTLSDVYIKVNTSISFNIWHCFKVKIKNFKFLYSSLFLFRKK